MIKFITFILLEKEPYEYNTYSYIYYNLTKILFTCLQLLKKKQVVQKIKIFLVKSHKVQTTKLAL